MEGRWKIPSLTDLPPPPAGKTGWPWTEASPGRTHVRADGAVWPRVSLVTPSFNQARYIEETIRSVLLQGYPDLEYIIMDGGSSDGTVDIIRQYEPWLAHWESNQDRGQSHAINKGLARATGTYFNWNNADDVLTPGSLAVTVEALLEHPETSAVTGYIVVIDAESHVISVNNERPELKGGKGFFLDTRRCVAELKTGCQPGCLMDRKLAVAVGGVDERIHYSMDQDLLLRLLLKRPIYHVDHPVILFRAHAESKTLSLTGARATERLTIAKTLFASADIVPEIRRLKFLSFAHAHRNAAVNYRDWGMSCKAAYHRALWFWDRWLYWMGCRSVSVTTPQPAKENGP